MAEKRMFTKIITESDLFLDMPLSAQCLYFHLNMEADDDGFIDSVKRIKRMIGASDDDLKLLIAKQFLIPFESGVIVIKHWRLHNTLRKDRYKETIHKDEKEQLQENEDRTYERLPNGCQTVANWLPNGCQMVAVDKISIDKNSIDKNRIEENREEKENSTPKTTSKHTSKRFIKPTIEEIKEYCAQNDLKIDCERFYDYYESNDWHVGKNKMKSWKATARNWNRNNYSNNKNASNSPIHTDNNKVYDDWFNDDLSDLAQSNSNNVLDFDIESYKKMVDEL